MITSMTGPVCSSTGVPNIIGILIFLGVTIFLWEFGKVFIRDLRGR